MDKWIGKLQTASCFSFTELLSSIIITCKICFINAKHALSLMLDIRQNRMKGTPFCCTDIRSFAEILLKTSSLAVKIDQLSDLHS